MQPFSVTPDRAAGPVLPAVDYVLSPVLTQTMTLPDQRHSKARQNRTINRPICAWNFSFVRFIFQPLKMFEDLIAARLQLNGYAYLMRYFLLGTIFLQEP